jgi:hypothetical protein
MNIDQTIILVRPAQLGRTRRRRAEAASRECAAWPLLIRIVLWASRNAG